MLHEWGLGVVFIALIACLAVSCLGPIFSEPLSAPMGGVTSIRFTRGHVTRDDGGALSP